MALNQELYFFVFSSFLFLFVSSSHSSSAYSTSAIEPTPPFHSNKVNAEKVTLSLYYESRCPYCRNFIVKPLADAVNGDLMTIVDLKLFPWGNAILQPNNTVVCQHGEDECYLNIIHACAINIWPDVMKHFELVKCIEEQHQVASEVSCRVCAEKLKLSSQSIKDCYDSDRGRQPLLKYGSLTNQLKLPRQYVPWVLVNGTPLFNQYGNFVQYVCKAYKGEPLPKACSSHHLLSPISKEKSMELVTHEGPAILKKSIDSVAPKRQAPPVLENSMESVGPPPKGPAILESVAPKCPVIHQINTEDPK